MASEMRQPPHLANAEDIESWADRAVEARTQFPSLVRRLIRQTNDQVTRLQMRSDLGAGTPGYDGIVEANRASPFVPAGRSVWELGTGRDPLKKANDDYRTRIEDPLGEDPSSTTFVFVTSRRWPEGEAWAQRKRIQGPWHDVQVRDVDDICVALDEALAAHYWLSELLGKPVAGVQMIEEWWLRFSTCTTPNLTPALVLAGRADEAAALLRILELDCRLTTVASASTDDVLAFVASVLLTSPDDTRADLFARTLIVRDPLSLRRLEATSGLLILLPFEDDLRREAQLILKHHVIFLAHEDGSAGIKLPPIDYDQFLSEVGKIGVEHGRAHELAAAARQSLVRFQHIAGAGPRAATPQWQSQLEQRATRRAWLAGAWSERRSGDQDVLSALLGAAYEDAVEELRPAAAGADPLFTVVGDAWKVSSAERSWPYARRRLTASDLAAVEPVIQTVLGAVDPALDLPTEERWKANIFGRDRIHSADLRRGLAETLALLSVVGDETRLSGGATVSSWAQTAAARLFQRAKDDQTGQLWASHSDVLPLLAEAAPDAFLTAVSDGLTGPKPLLTKLFTDHADTLSANSPHVGLVWALESVAWSDQHASYALQLLARLAEVDPGGRLSDRPLEILPRILDARLPQTTLPAERRLVVLDDLIARYPAVAWTVLVELLPGAGPVFPTYAPTFRGWKPAGEPAVTPPESLWPFIGEVIDRLLSQAGHNIERWKLVIDKLPSLSPQQRTKVRDRLSGLDDIDAATLTPAGRHQLWAALERLIRTQQTFADAPWALPDDELDQLNRIAERFKPLDPVEIHRFLFDDHVPDLGEGRRADHADYMNLLSTARRDAVVNIFSAAGLDGVLRLAGACELPFALGFALAETRAQTDDNQVVSLLDSSEPKLVGFASGYATRRLGMEVEDAA